jgi:hypothetical protein
VPCHRINKLGTHAHHRDRSTAGAIFTNGTYFLDNPRTLKTMVMMQITLRPNYDVDDNPQITTNGARTICWKALVLGFLDIN